MTRHILKIVWNRKGANALIVAEIFLSFLVLFAVLTLASALIGSVRQPLGFEWRNVWNISFEGDGKAGAADGTPVEFLLRELQAMPHVVAVGGSNHPPYAMSSMEGTWMIDGRSIFLTQDQVTDGFADVVRLKVIEGRWFGPQDDGADPSPVVIDADLAREVYGNESAIGKQLDRFRVVGVVAPYRKTGEFANFGRPINMLFQRVPVAKGELRNVLIRVQTGTAAAFEQVLSERLHQIAPHMNFRIRRLSRMRELAHRIALFPLIALVAVATFLISMVVLGLSGVLWQNVTRRRREIGLRRAVGASGLSVQKQIVAEVATLTTLAVILGVAIVAQLPMLGFFDTFTPSAFTGGLVGSLAAIYGLTVLCGLYPGWLASRVQPAEALHYE